MSVVEEMDFYFRSDTLGLRRDKRPRDAVPDEWGPKRSASGNWRWLVWSPSEQFLPTWCWLDGRVYHVSAPLGCPVVGIFNLFAQCTCTRDMKHMDIHLLKAQSEHKAHAGRTVFWEVILLCLHVGSC